MEDGATVAVVGRQDAELMPLSTTSRRWTQSFSTKRLKGWAIDVLGDGERRLVVDILYPSGNQALGSSADPATLMPL